MPVNPQESPFPGLTFAGELDDIQEMALEVTMTEDWNGYLNQRLLAMANANYLGRLAFVRFLPDTENGEVIMLPCGEDDYGAVELKYSETEKGAFLNLRLAVKRFKIQKHAGRVRVFPVKERKAPDGQVYLAFVIKETATRPARKLKKAGQAGSTPAAKPAETKPAETKPAETKPAETKPAETKPAESQETPKAADSVAAAVQPNKMD